MRGFSLKLGCLEMNKEVLHTGNSVLAGVFILEVGATDAEIEVTALSIVSITSSLIECSQLYLSSLTLLKIILMLFLESAMFLPHRAKQLSSATILLPIREMCS